MRKHGLVWVAVLTVAALGLGACDRLEIRETHIYGNLIAEQAATCLDDGLLAHYVCPDCGKVFDENKRETTLEALTLPAFGHDYYLASHEFSPDGTEATFYFSCRNEEGAAGYAPLAVPGYVERTAARENCVRTTVFHASAEFEGQEYTADLTVTAPDHTLVHYEKREPTCEEAGWYEHDRCSVCGKYFAADGEEETENEATMSAIGHDFSIQSAVTEGKASMRFVCRRPSCGAEFEQEASIVDERSFKEGCERTTVYTLSSELLGTTYEDRLVVTAEDHAAAEVGAREPTCEEAGFPAHSECQDCGKWLIGGETVDPASVEIPPTGHDYAWKCVFTEDLAGATFYFTCRNEEGTEGYTPQAVPANVTATSRKSGCERTVNAEAEIVFDGKEYKQTAEKTFADHTLVRYEKREPTCEEGGWYEHDRCSVCGKYFKVSGEKETEEEATMPALGHQYRGEASWEWQWEGFLAAFVTLHCERDGVQVRRAVITCDVTAPTCENEGSAAYTATYTEGEFSVSDHKTQTIAAAGHLLTMNWVWEDGSASLEATCGHCAYNEKVVATVTEESGESTYGAERVLTAQAEYGGEIYTDTRAYAAPQAHTFGDWIEEIAATCTAAGTRGHYVCSACGGNFDEDGGRLDSLGIPALGHDYDYETPEWEWVELGSSLAARLIFTCRHDPAHREIKEGAKMELAGADSAVQTEEGLFRVYTYSVRVTVNGEERVYVRQYRVPMPASLPPEDDERG